MNNGMRKIITIFIVLLNCICILAINAQEICLFQTHKNGIYKTGEKARIVFYLPESRGDSVHLKIQKNFTEQTPVTEIWQKDMAWDREIPFPNMHR